MNKKLSQKIEKLKTTAETVVLRDGNFTVAVVIGEGGAIRSFGVAKRNPTDRDDPAIGENIAVARAARKLLRGGRGTSRRQS